ncbi:MAG TPA: hypothetical protein VF141_12515 [Chryseolinea sp.]
MNRARMKLMRMEFVCEREAFRRAWKVAFRYGRKTIPYKVDEMPVDAGVERRVENRKI